MGRGAIRRSRCVCNMYMASPLKCQTHSIFMKSITGKEDLTHIPRHLILRRGRLLLDRILRHSQSHQSLDFTRVYDIAWNHTFELVVSLNIRSMSSLVCWSHFASTWYMNENA